jgi:hypothetical protein
VDTPYWRECKILSYDNDTRLYQIQWKDSDKMKKVSRANLIYDFEDIEEHEERMANAKEKQKKYEAIARYHFYLRENSS